MSEPMSDILWRRLRYMLSPQFDLYKSIAPRVYRKFVLEIGFGTGFGTIQLAQCAKTVVAIEPDSNAVKFAQQVLPIPNIMWGEGDIVNIPGHAPLYDTAILIETLEHIGDWEKALFNIHSMLVDGGELIMTARNNAADLRRNDLHEREWSGQELKDNLSRWFSKVELYDYKMDKELPEDTHITPLIAIATK